MTKINLKKKLLIVLILDGYFPPHWSWLIQPGIYNKYNCVLFHITDLPFGRGGSPLQNLILRKIYNTKISAIKVTKEVDSGQIYIKEDFYIGLGSANEIFSAASDLIFLKMIPFIINKNPKPIEQIGEIISFKRRKPEESNIKLINLKSLNDFYDFIRMLDGEGYPKAFMKFGKFKIEFSEVHKKNDKIIGSFEIFEGDSKNE